METKNLKNKIRFPKLRFKEFRGEWQEKKLGDVADIISGQSPNGNAYNSNGHGLPLYQGKADFGAMFTAEPEVWTTEKTKIAQPEDILISVRAPVGPTNLASQRLNIGRGLAAIRTWEGTDRMFLFYYLRLKEKIIAGLGGGSAFSSITRNDLISFKIYFPKFKEQQKIADFLTAVDEKIEKLEERKKRFEEYKKGIMQKIFSQEMRFKDKNGKNFPDWEEKKLGELVEFKNGKSFENRLCESGKYNLITLNSINIKGKLQNEHKRVEQSDKSLEKDDLVMVMSDVAHGNFLGLCAVIPDNNYVLNQRMGALKPKTINVFFLRYYINNNQLYFKRHGQGSSQLNLSKGDILKFKIPIPQKEEQQKITEFLTSLDDKIESINKKLEQARLFKKSLLQQMFV